MPFAAVNGIDVYFELHGAGPPLLNISGSGNDLRRSPASILPVNKAFETLSYDQRGLGRTSKPETEYTMVEYADDAAALIHSVGWSRCHVLDTSFGGMVALNLAVRHPDVVGRLVLCCTSPGGVAPSFPLHELGELEPEDAFVARMRLTDRRWDPDADEPIPGLAPTTTRWLPRRRPSRTPTSSPDCVVSSRRVPATTWSPTCRRSRHRRRCAPVDTTTSPRWRLRTARRPHSRCNTAGVRRRTPLHDPGPICLSGHHRFPPRRAVIRLRQVALIAPDLDPVVEELSATFGLQVCFHDPGVAEFGLRNALLLVGDQFIEVLSPIREGTTVQRLLDKRGGAGGYMAIFEVDDLDERIERLAANDVRIVWAGDFGDIRGRHLHPHDVGGTLVSLDEPVPDGSWRWGGPDWQARSDELLHDATVGAIGGVVASAVDPDAMRERWTRLGFDRDVSFAPAGGRGDGLDEVSLVAIDRARVGERTEIGGVVFTLV